MRLVVPHRVDDLVRLLVVHADGGKEGVRVQRGLVLELSLEKLGPAPLLLALVRTLRNFAVNVAVAAAARGLRAEGPGEENSLNLSISLAVCSVHNRPVCHNIVLQRPGPAIATVYRVFRQLFTLQR